MAEAVLDTPPGSPGQSSVGRKRMSGGRGSLMSLTGSISPPSNSAVLDSSVPDESFFRRSDSDDSLPSSNVLGNNIFRRSNSARRGPTENSFNNSGVMSYFGGLSQTNESSPFFAKLGNGSNTILSFYQNMGQDAAPVDAFSPHDKICPIDNGQDTISKDFSLKNKTTN